MLVTVCQAVNPSLRRPLQVVVFLPLPVARGLHSYTGMTYAIVRQSGRSAERYRLVLTTTSAEMAITTYDDLWCALRQGTVELLASTGHVIASCTAPRLRTRW